MTTPTLEAIDQLLPQTQCRECGFDGCKPYAKALIEKSTSIDKCAPGGIPVLNALAESLEQDPRPYYPSVKNQYRPPATARVIEADCIGCTKCIQACPVDAIIGASKQMHQIIADECTGCGLCVEPCPVDCIELIPLDAPRYDIQLAKQRFEQRDIRLERQAQDKVRVYKEGVQTHQKQSQTPAMNKDYIQQALARKAQAMSRR